MPELLKGTWLIANNRFWETRAEFIHSFQEFFLPRGFMTKLADQVRQRKQRHGECCKDYKVDMQILMWPLGMSQKEILKRIRENSTPALRMFVRPYECRHLDDLMALTDEFEELDSQRERFESERTHRAHHQRDFTRGEQHAMHVEINAKVDELLQKGCIEPFRYSSPIVMVKKKTGQWRVGQGGPEMMPHAFAYQDDIIVIGRTQQEHKRNLKEVFRRLRAANLKVNAEKCKFFRKELQYLGHRATDQGIGTDPEKVPAIAQLKPPGNLKELRQCLGVASWYRRFVPDFATLVQPLNALLKKQARWEWTDAHQEAFEAVKTREDTEKVPDMELSEEEAVAEGPVAYLSLSSES
ncbi:uncharacterized protein LOC122319525 [Drosophila yakuba]|uniref:uncharacterized protein LOC122319525 n=1 Tax=Drosophila yakuba TaxID=7245 RepID=UPI001C8A5A15|nr:uncharacterized protein LOC122319525 [Drosophila yakuba]